jgi:hypothetical protein
LCKWFKALWDSDTAPMVILEDRIKDFDEYPEQWRKAVEEVEG